MSDTQDSHSNPGNPNPPNAAERSAYAGTPATPKLRSGLGLGALIIGIASMVLAVIPFANLSVGLIGLAVSSSGSLLSLEKASRRGRLSPGSSSQQWR
ncbi:MAG TPA: hypothetical protein VIJ18_07365 [Microbacteriaceae bacterium]